MARLETTRSKLTRIFNLLGFSLISTIAVATVFGQAVDPTTQSRTSAKNTKAQFPSAPDVVVTQGFEDTTFPPSGWSANNQSGSTGSNAQCWNRFTATPWAPHTGVGHAGANFNCAANADDISGWLISPVFNLHNGDTIKFWTRKASPDSFPDRLELRLSTNGGSVNVGSGPSAVGDFTTLLVSVNPTLVTGVYPTTFTQFTGTISGLGGPTLGRFAFRYWVTDAGPNGANSDIISIDDVDYGTFVTAAHVNVAGKIQSSNGSGLRNARVTLTRPDGTTVTAITNAFGYFSFDEVEIGDNYVVAVSARGYQFTPRVLKVVDTVSDLVITPE